MDPLLIVFGFGVGMLVGMTGMGGGSLMTPLLFLVFGVKPTVAVGSDIVYQAITKTVGGFKHLRLRTVNMGATGWLALGSIPGALGGVQVVNMLKDRYGEDVETFTVIALASVLTLVGLFTLARSLLFPVHDTPDDTPHEALHTWQRGAAIAIGVTTGFVIGITSAGSGTVIAVALIAIFKIPPRYVVGTDVFHAALLLWAAGLAHIASGSVDFGLVGTLLLGSVPGVYLGAHFSVKVPESALRTALGVVLIASAVASFGKAGVEVVPQAVIAVTVVFIGTCLTLIFTGRRLNPWTMGEAHAPVDDPLAALSELEEVEAELPRDGFGQVADGVPVLRGVVVDNAPLNGSAAHPSQADLPEPQMPVRTH